MKKLLLFIAAVAVAATATAKGPKIVSSADEVIVHWNNDTAPHSNCDTKSESITPSGKGYKVAHTTETVFYLFKAKNPTGQSLIIFPGGGYSVVSLSFGMAEWLRDNGITAMVVKYRLPNGHKEVPLEDAAAAIEYMRNNAERLGLDPQKIGVSGSSAGGHLRGHQQYSKAIRNLTSQCFSILLSAHRYGLQRLSGAPLTSFLATFAPLQRWMLTL